jgi:hypothetical protein
MTRKIYIGPGWKLDKKGRLVRTYAHLPVKHSAAEASQQARAVGARLIDAKRAL